MFAHLSKQRGISVFRCAWSHQRGICPDGYIMDQFKASVKLICRRTLRVKEVCLSDSGPLKCSLFWCPQITFQLLIPPPSHNWSKYHFTGGFGSFPTFSAVGATSLNKPEILHPTYLCPLPDCFAFFLLLHELQNECLLKYKQGPSELCKTQINL